MKILALILCYYLSFAFLSEAEQCGRQAGGKLCPGGLCCGEYGWCGTTDAYCGEGCQSNCTTPTPPPPPTPTPPFPPGGGEIGKLISKEMFEEMLLHRNDDANCAIGFYIYEAFIVAANFFPGFGTTGNNETRKREIAAFFGQTSHETTGGWPDAPEGPYTWGYCYKEEQGDRSDHCDPSHTEWPCATGKKYYGRGPIQISYNYNYGLCGNAIGYDLLNDPDKVASDAYISFETAIWFWMTPQSPKPSCHEVMTNQWTPSEADKKAGRLPGYGVTTNIINGGKECGIGTDSRVEDRIGFYKRYCDMYGIGYGDNLDCYDQKPFGSGVKECSGINCVANM